VTPSQGTPHRFPKLAGPRLRRWWRNRRQRRRASRAWWRSRRRRHPAPSRREESRWLSRQRRAGVSLGKIPDTHYPYPNYPNPRYPIPNLDSDFDYPKLVWVIRVISPGTQTIRTTQTFDSVFVFIMCR
jgi:hypothetical protein